MIGDLSARFLQTFRSAESSEQVTRGATGQWGNGT